MEQINNFYSCVRKCIRSALSSIYIYWPTLDYETFRQKEGNLFKRTSLRNDMATFINEKQGYIDFITSIDSTKIEKYFGEDEYRINTIQLKYPQFTEPLHHFAESIVIIDNNQVLIQPNSQKKSGVKTSEKYQTTYFMSIFSQIMKKEENFISVYASQKVLTLTHPKGETTHLKKICSQMESLGELTTKNHYLQQSLQQREG